MEQTFALIKPNAIRNNQTGFILQKFQKEGLKLIGLKMLQVSKEQCQEFYKEHKEKPFFKELVDFITSSPVIALALQGENAVLEVRKMMGDTDPKKALPGTIRHECGESLSKNAVHGSDTPENAKRELDLFFSKTELFFL